ncbi:MAG: type IV secretory system conjugative DNA transfer family protein [Clostridia bacterium]|nr:type IV secretory system conjugative DNA transfer family protein [Clostridia bacterium]
MQGGKYVVWDTSKDAHILIVGGSGSGKSSCFVIPFLLSNPDTCVFAVDVKGELVMKGRELSDPRICVFSPMDHSGYGFDPFHGLSTDSSPQLILETMQTVVFSLIPLGTSKETFWPISARNMLIGLMIYYFNHGRHDLIEIIDSVLGSPVRDQIEEIINTEDPSGNAYKYLVQFYGMADETLLSVYSNMANSLSCFSDINLRWAFSGAARKVNALTLESGKSVFLAIPEHKLAPWSGVLAMIINLTLDTLSKRPEGKNRIFFLLDELGRIISSGGAMDGLVDASMTLRSRGVTLCMVVQQIESLETGFSEAKTTTLIGNCNIKIILDASSSKTQQTVCRDWVPKYFQRKQSKSTGGKGPNNNFSFEETERLSPADLMALPKNGEAVVITPLGYTMIKKCPYYKDDFLKKRADRVSSHNKEAKR